MPPRCPKPAPRRRQDVPRRHKMPRHALKTPQVHPKTTRRHRARRSQTLQDAPKTATNPKWVPKSKSVDSSLLLEASLEPKTPEQPPKWDQIGTKWDQVQTKWDQVGTKLGPNWTKWGQ